MVNLLPSCVGLGGTDSLSELAQDTWNDYLVFLCLSTSLRAFDFTVFVIERFVVECFIVEGFRWPVYNVW
jgi:hypothetical protein